MVILSCSDQQTSQYCHLREVREHVPLISSYIAATLVSIPVPVASIVVTVASIAVIVVSIPVTVASIAVTVASIRDVTGKKA